MSDSLIRTGGSWLYGYDGHFEYEAEEGAVTSCTVPLKFSFMPSAVVTAQK